ncbi:heavy metal-associated domain protein [Brevibacterium mcbrellneri ATCC 49030]|uniref:Heavy metal-associated domain protein n=1 Tax=Brevibacterium mcbrellneri ATCC 49030 TaxID=585530 RepID=D4YMD8_9MICO|nr:MULTISPECIES: heavy-metal-associated domain-containing protein [Brevibacterium]EFG47599.1 heavy metal-associated domain protein [Brevibacterium mcbrellneri ATCC 49030]MDK8347026.1 heavy-metal-associated domain-containing protein [Brevibacterium sp. UMB1308B]MDK8714250.1 heavy-metal-associated domain-containing protein [Brevibacterium sp. UMB1308A]
MTTTTFRTEPFTCPSCVAKIETAVGRVDGVEKVDVKFNSSRVVVDHEEARASAASIRKIIDDLGYPVKSVS